MKPVSGIGAPVVLQLLEPRVSGRLGETERKHKQARQLRDGHSIIGTLRVVLERERKKRRALVRGPSDWARVWMEELAI